MWVPGGIVFLAVGVGLMGLWLRETEMRSAPPA